MSCALSITGSSISRSGTSSIRSFKYLKTSSAFSLFCLGTLSSLRQSLRPYVLILEIWFNLTFKAFKCVVISVQWVFTWDTHLCMSLFPSVHPSVCPSVAHNILGTVHHLIETVGTRVKWWYLQVFFLYFFWNFDFLVWYVGGGRGGGFGGGKRAKNSPKWKITITCVMCHISGRV